MWFKKENTGILFRRFSWKTTSGKILQPILGFTLTFLVSFNLLFWQNGIPTMVSLYVAGGSALVVAVCIGFSKTVRCICTLSIPQLMSGQGRAILLSIITGLLIGGPVLNITRNADEVSKIVQCVANISYQHGLDIKEAYESAYEDITEAVKSSSEPWRQLAEQVDKIIDPISDGLEIVRQGVRSFGDSVSDAASQCKDKVGNAASNCFDKVNSAESDCRSKIPDFLHLDNVCNVLNIGSAACEGVGHVQTLCAPVDRLTGRFTHLTEKIVDVLQDVSDIFKFEIEYNDKLVADTNSTDLEKLQNKIKYEYTQAFETVGLIVRIIQYVLISTIFLIPFKAWLYLRSKLGQKSKNKTKIKNDAKKLKKELKMQIAVLILHFLLTAAIITFDYVLYYIQHVVEKNGEASFEVSGELGVSLTISTGKAIQPLIDNFVNSFSVDRKHNFTTNTDACLPNPTEPEWVTLIPVGILYLIAVVFTFIGNKILSIRQQIVHHFYPEIKEQREIAYELSETKSLKIANEESIQKSLEIANTEFQAELTEKIQVYNLRKDQTAT